MPGQTDLEFTGAVPEAYDTLLVPMLFAPWASRLAAHAARLAPGDVLETAAGTGALTRALAASLPPGTRLVATDLNAPMLARAAAMGTARPVRYQAADALALPFPDASFDLVACQFGAMFFPDRAAGFREARRVLRPGGTFLFATWGPIARNALGFDVQEALARVFPADPPRFLERTPHGYHDLARIRADLAAAGYAGEPTCEVATERSRAPKPSVVAAAYCLGSPLRGEIEARGAPGLEAAALAVAAHVAGRHGSGPVDAPMEAIVVLARA